MKNAEGVFPSLPARNERGESWREGKLIKNGLLSPTLSSFFGRRGRREALLLRSKENYHRGSHFRSRPIPAIHVGKDVVQPLDSPEPLFVHAGRSELFVQGDEAKQVVLDTAAGVVGTRAGAEYERPIAGLGEQQLARRLFERALRQSAGAGKFSRQFGHSLLRDVQVRINPFVRFVEPHPPVAFLPPARRARRGDLLGRVPAQIFLRREQDENFLIVISL